MGGLGWIMSFVSPKRKRDKVFGFVCVLQRGNHNTHSTDKVRTFI